ncbi:MAG: hypothetical protein PHN40_02125 [Dysgonamonadaceae bacterium]|nr:hypothetical protein [Dysgonamonadaceae bacterium]MDD4605337.1 hypothetical protein [Dysgonamonadaceae bacterium]
MTTFNRMKFQELAKTRCDYAVSIYIPIQRGGDNRDKSMIKLKNHVQETEKELGALGLKPREIEDFLKPINGMLDDSTLFRNLSESLAIFRCKSSFEYYTLPIEVEEFSVVSHTFYLLPLLPFFNKKDSFYIFTLSQNKNRLFEATQQHITEIDTGEDFPSSFKDLLGKDTVSQNVNIHGVGSRGRDGEVYSYGKGETDIEDKEWRLYLEDINRALTNVIGLDGEPLVIASVESTFGHFKEYSSYKNIYPEYLSGNFEEESAQVLHERAKEILQPYFDEVKTDKKEVLIDGNVPQVSDLKETIIAADSGRISTLFVAKGKHAWGIYKPEEAKVEIHETKKEMDICLLDLAARKTFLKGGKVFMVEQENLPNKDTKLNAALRF